MKRFLKLCSLTLVLAMLCSLLPATAFAQELQEIPSANAEAVLQPQTTAQAEIVAELTEKRSEYAKEFLLSNGLHLAMVYADPVHYEKDGQWAEIDNRLTTAQDGTVTNTAGVWNVSFPQQLKGGNVTIEKDGYTLSFSMEGELRSSGELMTAAMGTEATEQLAVGQLQTASAAITQTDTAALRESYEYAETAPEKLYSQLRYDRVYANTDVIYDLQANTVKESIVMGSYSSTLRGYRYTLNVGELIPVLEEDGQISFYGKDRNETVMVMPAPYLLDADSAYNDDIQVQLTGSNGTYTLTYLLPRQWLAAQDRAWPVLLDPVVQADVDANNILDRTVCENKTYSYTWSLLDAGYSAARGKIRSYLRYKELPTITSSDVVVSAQLAMYKVITSTTTHAVELHKVTETWDSQTVTWDSQPSFSAQVEDYQNVRSEDWYYWNITDMVQDWYATENFGVAIKLSDAVENGGTDAYRQFYSADTGSSYRPHLAIKFRNNNGLEDYWEYTTSSAGRAGTGYVNLYTGNLTWVRSDIGLSGNLMPVSINHVYNANDAITPDDDTNANDSGGNSFGMGIGWRTNYNQLVYKWSEDSTYYVWEDSDGTDHYFEKVSSGKYQDEDGLELTLTTTGTKAEKYKITDKTGNTSVFDQYGRLVKLQNNQATPSHVEIAYTTTSGKKIQKITDGAGRKYLFDYNSAGLLIRIRYTGTKAETLDENALRANGLSFVTFSYTDQQLTGVTNLDGKTSVYTYNSAGLLTSAQDIDGYLLSYSYNTPADPWQPYRVMSVSGQDNGQSGGSLTFTYGHNRTTLEDHNENKEIHHFNECGNTVAIQDSEGHAAYAQYARTAATDENGKANQLTLSSKLQNTVANQLRYGGFETGSDWRKISSPSNSASSAVSLTTEQAHTGSYSLKLTVASPSASNAAYSPDVVLKPGETVTFSYYVLITANTGTASLYRRISGGSSYIKSIPLQSSDQWQRVQFTYTNDTGETAYMRISFFAREIGTYYIDTAQGEKSAGASRYNLVENGDFHYEGAWTTSGFTASDLRTTVPEPAVPQLDSAVYQMTGDAGTSKEISQRLEIGGSAEDTYVLSGWAKGDSVPLKVWLSGAEDFTDEGRFFGLKATFHNTDDTTTERTVSFNPDTQDSWQYAATPVVADKDYTAITVSAVYANNLNTVCFDGIQLYREEFGNSYTYDEDGNLISVVDLQKKNTTYEYDSSNLTAILEDNKAKMRYEYDTHHNVIKAATQKENEAGETVDDIVYEFAYDDWGNNTEVKIKNGDSTITTSATYTDDHNRMATSTDDLANVTTYCYNKDTNVLEWVQYPNDSESSRTTYTYDSMYRMASAAANVSGLSEGTGLSANYTYNNDLLTEITSASTTYSFSYGAFSQRTGIHIGERLLASYEYTDDQNRYLKKLTYGNGGSVEYTYDKKGRTTKETFENGDTVTYAYDNDGALATMTDSATGRTTTYYYDVTDRLMKYVESGTGFSHGVQYGYDNQNNLTKLTETINGVVHRTEYTYDSQNRLIKTDYGDVVETLSYDAFGRMSSTALEAETEEATENTGITQTAFQYKTEGNTTSTQLSALTVTGSVDTLDSRYTYDGNGNITHYQLLDADGETLEDIRYHYDTANQLVREDNLRTNTTTRWVYDNAGNIRERKEYTYTTAIIENWDNLTASDSAEYTYSDTSWGDLLTAYDGQVITYDTVGNPLNDGTWTYTWQNGRELASMTTISDGTDGDDSNSVTWEYTYDAGGMRTGRTDGTTNYTYVYNGSQLTQMTKGNDTLYFTYGTLGPTTVTWNGTTYYYAVNAQGDVTGIFDSTGTCVVTYYCDNAWGYNPTPTGTLASTLGTLNPLRYRGYVYDVETGLYYLNSRYYNPQIGRFISADNAENLAADDTLVGFNLFAYCANNPVNRFDGDGNWSLPNWAKVAIGVTIIAAAAAVTIATGGAAAGTVAAAVHCAAQGAFVGAVTQGAIGTVTGAASGAISHRVSTGSWKGAGQAAIDGAATGFMEGTISGAVSGATTSSYCFVAGTTVLTVTGSVAIENIREGDYVWAWDEATGDIALKPVVQLFVNQATELVHVTVNGEEIICTNEHPFYSPVKGWTDACKLRAGDILVTVNGEYVVVEKIQHEILESPISVYNFEVEDYHTYYVGSGLLVHNRCGGENAATKRGRQMHKDWDYGPGVSKEVTIAKGSRVDGIDYVNKIVYELKPNNTRSIKRGLKQLNRYLSILGEDDWAGVLVLY